MRAFQRLLLPLLAYLTTRAIAFTFHVRVGLPPSSLAIGPRKAATRHAHFHNNYLHNGWHDESNGRIARRRTYLHESRKMEDRELRWNMVNLLRKEEEDSEGRNQALKRQSLLAVLEVARNQESRFTEELSSPSVQPSSPSVPTRLASMGRFLCTSQNAKEHEGCFRIFHENCESSETSTAGPTTSLPPNLLFSMDKPLTFIRQNLSYYRSDETKAKRGGMMCDNSEAVVWCVSEEQNLEYSSRVLDDMPFVQLHMGDFEDDAYLLVDLDSETVGTLDSLGLLEWDVDNSDAKHYELEIYTTYKLRSADLDVIRTVLSCCTDGGNEHVDNQIRDERSRSLLDSRPQQTLIKLIDAAVESVRNGSLNGKTNEPHLVLMAHSLSASAVAAALSTWKQDKLRTGRYSTSRVEIFLHQAVTVVTFSNVCQSFCDGPAYIHISMWDDPFARALGSTITRQHNKGCGGSRAVFFHSWSPYGEAEAEDEDGDLNFLCQHSMRTYDAHNMNACEIQFLCLIMRINGIQSFRALYDAARYVDPRTLLDIPPSFFAVDYCKQGDLVIPPMIDDELLPGMIRATGGDQWLWNDYDNNDLNIEDEGLLPDEEEAKTYLEEFFGYSAYEEICETMCETETCSSD